LREAVQRKRPVVWTNNTWMLHHDNAPAHTSLLIRRGDRRGDRRKDFRTILQNMFPDTFQNWKKHWEWCIKSGGGVL